MSVVPRTLVIATPLLALAAVASLLLAPEASVPPKPLVVAQSPGSRNSLPSAPGVPSLLGPWAKPPQPLPPAVVVPVPPPPPPPPVIDRTSVRYVGTLLGSEDLKTFLFKFLPSGRILTLIEGREANGWLLVSVSERSFTLQGPGGQYAVSR